MTQARDRAKVLPVMLAWISKLMQHSADTTEETAHKSRGRNIAVIAGLFLVAGLSWYLGQRFDSSTIERFGYVGIFLVSLLSNASVLLPLAPTIAVVIAGAWWLDPLWVAIVAAIGSAIGELVGYALGVTGKRALPETETVARLERWLRHHTTGMVVLFILAAVPNPAVDIAGILAGAVGYPWWTFLLVVTLGRLLRYGLLAVGASFWVGS